MAGARNRDGSAEGAGSAVCDREEIAHLRSRILLLEAVIENFPGGLSLFDDQLRMVLCNGRQKEMLDYPDALIAGRTPTMEEIFRFNARRGEYGEGDVEQLVRHRLDLVRQRVPHCYDRTRPNGTVLEVRGMPLAGGGFVTTYQDVTDQRGSLRQIAHMAQHDALTDLPNRLLFNERLGTAIAQVKRGGRIAVHILDLDNFKPVNDAHGHQAGDAVLVCAAERMRASARETDTIARLGGDEFAIVQTGIRGPADAAALARRMLDVLSEPFRIAGRDVFVGVSIGIALAPADGSTADELMSKADCALYASKTGGRGRISFHRRGEAPARGPGCVDRTC